MRMDTGTNTPGAGQADLPIHHAETSEGGAFYVEADGERLAHMSYARGAPGHVVIEHTEVSERLRGRGVARRLVDAAVDWARATGTKLSATCSYAKGVLEKDPSLRDVIG
jgi:predicted GNAT family acetyltransferase